MPSKKSRKAEADRLRQHGIELYEIGNFNNSFRALQQALRIYQSIQDRMGEGNTLGNLGNVYFFSGNQKRAIELHRKHLLIAREVENRLEESKALGNLGNAFYALGDYDNAARYQKKSLDIAREAHDRQGEGSILVSLGHIYHAKGEFHKAVKSYLKGLEIARKVNKRLLEGKALGSLGLLYSNLGNYIKAIEYSQEYLVISRKIKDRGGEGVALEILGYSYFLLGEYAEAILHFHQSLEIARDIHSLPSEESALCNLGNAYNLLRDNSLAIECYQKSLDIARKTHNTSNESKALGSLGIAYYSEGNYTEAIKHCQQSLEIAQKINNRPSVESALVNLGRSYSALKQYAKAIDYYQQGLAISREIHNRPGEGLDLHYLGLTLFRSGELEASEKALRDSIEIWESLRVDLRDFDIYKVSIFEKQRRTYSTLQQVLVAQNKLEEALEIAERGRARALLELLSRRFAPQLTELPNLKQYPVTIQEIRQIVAEQNATIVEYSIIPDEFRFEETENTNLAELFIWVISPNAELRFERVDLTFLWQQEQTSLKDLVQSTRLSIGVRGRDAAVVKKDKSSAPDHHRLRQLFDLLIQPIADLLPKKDVDTRIIFIPQDVLFLVPFSALQNTSGKYLIELYTVLTSPSIQILEKTRQQRQKVHEAAFQNALILGNPTMPSIPSQIGKPSQPLRPLPGSENEAKAVAALLHTQAIIGDQATKAIVIQKILKARIIHLATHGLLDDVQGLGSAMILAPSGNDNGLLTAEDILKLKLNAELAVLSACDTGQGRITGDGVIGLSRSFVSAGVSSIVVSLWSIPDAPTALLMTEFYKNFLQSSDKAQALRQAMLTTMKQHPHPRDWAAFILIGEAE